MRTHGHGLVVALIAALALSGGRSNAQARGSMSHAPPQTASAAPAPSGARASLLTCPLEVRSFYLGERSSAPGVPFASGDGVGVVFHSMNAPRDAAIVYRRLDARGALAAPVVLREHARGASAPVATTFGEGIFMPFENAGVAGLAAWDLPSGVARADAPPPLLPAGYVVGLASGERGMSALVRLATRAHVLVRGIPRNPLPNVQLPEVPLSFEPPERLLASGARADVVLALRRVSPEAVALDLVVAGASATPRTTELGRSAQGPNSTVAAGPSGFLVAWGTAERAGLTLVRLDPDGARVGDPIELRPPADNVTMSYPRVAPLETGWALTYWDGTGPVLQRLDANARAIGAPVLVRSGDERGGHTAAEVALVNADTLALGWEVAGPRFGHGTPGEIPRQPGGRLATVRCRR